LSNTEANPDDAAVATRSAHSRPVRFGSLRIESGTGVIRSPTRVPPPGRENTLRPSNAERPSLTQYR
jgi:hypothetical protein